MMKNRNIHIIKHIFFGCVALACMASCADDDLFTGNRLQYDPDALLFEAYIGRSNVATRAGETPEELDPLVLQGDDAPLYLHTYVCDNSFNPVENPQPDTAATTRGAQVNSVADFLTVHQKFGVQARYADDFNEVYVSPISTVKINQGATSGNQDCAVWRVDGNKVYWPGNDAMLSIHAWAPFNFPADLKNEWGKISFSYTAQRSADGKTDAEAQTDILLASVDCKKSLATMELDSYKAAKLQFTHPLSAIKFEVRDVLKATIKSISIKNVYTKGDCMYQLAGEGNGYYTDPQSGVYTWTNHSEVGDFYQEFNVTVGGQLQRPTDDKKDESVTAKRPKATFMMIPQKISEDAEIEIVMEQTDRKNPDDTPAANKEVKLSGKILDNEVTEWLPGKEYVYTISTNSENWTYVFDVKGSYRNQTEIYMPSPADNDEFYVGDRKDYEPYFQVVSYRYRSNNPNVWEALPWTAEHGDGVQYYYPIINGKLVYQNFAEKDAVPYQNRTLERSERDDIPALTWLTDLSANKLKGDGGKTADKHKLSFRDAIVTTDWNGDLKMYEKKPYSGNSESNPWDLSTFGGKRSRNTANCYVVDREGWYSIPLYYGNAIKDGARNPGAWSNVNNLEDLFYTYKGSRYDYYALFNFKDHKGTRIASTATGEISTSYYNSAHLLWQDTYGLIENVKLDKTNKRIIFHVNRNNIQQGNAVIGLSALSDANWTSEIKKDSPSPQIVWSWHIWINEHWLNDAGISNAFDSNGFDTEILSVSDMQNQGDLAVTVPQENTANTIRTYTVAPYNIGWCDAKNVRYLSRYNTMKFEQYDEKGKSRTKAELPIIQDGRTIQYKYGNNTYYQFGRKDPFVGFLDHNQTLKDHFGDLEYEIKPQYKTLAYSIQHPNQLFVGASAHASGNPHAEWNAEDDWVAPHEKDSTEFYNLWNNTAYNKTVSNSPAMSANEYFTYSKTIYDPSPAGYVIPPSGFFKILLTAQPHYTTYNKAGKATDNKTYNVNGSYLPNLYRASTDYHDGFLNGVQQDSEGFLYRIYTSRTSKNKFFSLTSTGHRWYATTVQDPGSNFNPNIVYLWSSHVTKNTSDRGGFSAALGKDGANYIVSPAFNGRKSMARPVRCIRETNNVRSN